MSNTKCPQCGGVNLKWAPHRMLGCSDCGWEERPLSPAMDLSTLTDGGTHRLYPGCVGSEKPMTNADRIRAMSDEGLAEAIINGVSSDACDYCEHDNGYCDGFPYRGKEEAEIIMDWLQQPAKEDA